ncbi:anion permease [Lactiplantibacillus mudanjiangensis]|uniref:Malate transporter [Lactobacillus oligofermentans DSM = LMG 22743] n=1 Tax=Lactiplantibacillus mudanjiangensis TaxID=1296538 RepID=A0A660E0B5_9LACO|nr:anion permease [Lactiplantibacillus mudanjiangensis]VDG23077.1 Putative malate transporter [Lactobacillus oligofermentans DSM = LMG 22743] [Lactiplantibacillus mudanjiangensis]VDG29550.1 Putative malate transporter [Lactobacillus oligofermentans DSM = LMG 22743] [Lactiplantibacillus mudanjiangensis]VDG32663.1 Putative malate transporter [Lactobacillus oligofermentans DSM = LMG 22743] [Lactiplantibacillus mudanjiangensis]
MSLEKVNYKKFIAPLVVGILLWVLSPVRPVGLSIGAWHMFAIFVATIIGCITQPLPIGGVAILGFTIAVLTHEIPIDTAIAGFGNSSIWLIVMAFFISRGFIKTGLGRRIALEFVGLFGKRTLGLAYSLIGVDLILAPATPSNTARAGGIMYPIINSLSEAFGSSPKQGTQRKIGSFLMFAEFHGDMITAAMFLTAMAGNPLAQSLAKSMGVHITWMNWFIAGVVPGIISLILVPFIIYKMFPPEIKETPNAKQWSESQLKEMGALSLPEKFMAGIFVIALLLWVTGSLTGIDATLTAFIALSLLLLCGVLSWSDVTHETGAWNTLTWFSVLVMMATQLNTQGFIPWLSKQIAGAMSGLNWIIVLIVLILAYFYSHYLFASATAHVSAMYSALLGVAISAHVPAMLAALMLGFFSNLFSSTTHYSNGPAPILFGSGYVSQNDWWRMNAILAFVYFIVWIGIGSLWMKLIGMW